MPEGFFQRMFIIGIGLMGIASITGGYAQITDFNQLDKAVEFIERTRPVYPPEQRRAGMQGSAVISFVIDPDGRMSRCEVSRQTSKEFGEAAWIAVNQWKVAPGTVKGKPVTFRGQVPIIFSLGDGLLAERVDAVLYGLPLKASNKESLEYRYTTPPKVLLTEAPVYPYQAWMEQKAGSADVAYAVNAEGWVFAVKIIKASSPEFGFALATAVERWRFSPASRKGKPIKALGRVSYDFDNYLPTDAPEKRLRKVLLEDPDSVSKMSALDRPLRPIHQVAPLYPLAVMGEGAAGEVIVDCVVDRDGWVRLPHIVSASREEFGWAAMAALREWRFEVPLADGKPIDVRVRVPFGFAPLKPASPVQ